jgi:DNA-binding response OmpR family regulator
MTDHILIVDDEHAIRRILRAYLEADGFVVSEAPTASAALAAVAGHVDLVLLDVGLPDLDGLETLRRIRATSDLPVILVTARADEVDTLVGLAVGADDYIAKPFSPREVVARTKTVLRRSRLPARAEGQPDSRRVLAYPGLTIDLDRREVRRDGVTVEVSALEFDLLTAFAEAPGRVFSRVQLLEKVWGYDVFNGERVVDVHVRSLRSLLHDDASDPTVIGTVRGVGYKFLLEPR